MNKILRLSVTALLVVACIGITGCSDSKEAKTLTAPEGVDWAAIEAEGEAMNDLQSEGE